MKLFLALLFVANVSQAVEVFDPVIKGHFSLIETSLEDTIMGICSWDEKVFTAQEPGEYYSEIHCKDGSYATKFGVWLMPQEIVTFRAEGYSVSDNLIWHCVVEGQIDRDYVSSGMSCQQLE